MKKIILFIALFFVIGCVKEKDCENTEKGIIIPTKPYYKTSVGKVYAIFFRDADIDDLRVGGGADTKFFKIYITNKLPKEYAVGDSIAVRISHDLKHSIGLTIPAYRFTCIEKIE